MSVDAAFVRLREANPVPRPAALRDTPQDAPGFLLATRQRSREMQTELKQSKPVETPRAPRRRWVPALAAFVVAIVAVGSVAVFSGGSGSDAAAAEDVARAFIEAKNAGDADAAIALFAPSAIIDDRFVGDSAEGYREDIAWGHAVGAQEVIGECTTNPAAESSSRHLVGYAGTEARCTYTFENDWTRALGIGPFQPSARYRFVVEDGQIVHLIHTADNSGFFQAWEAFRSWIFRNHTVDVGVLYEIGETSPKKDEEANALWKQRTEEFVAEQNQ